MLSKFRKIIDEDYPQGNPDLFLVAVSGGPDSMVLLDLLRRGEYPINVLHCHFGLRSKAYIDTRCVIGYCREHDIPLNIKYFPGQKAGSGESIQMLCRQWRYDWFDQQLAMHEGSILVTAHHLNDNVETFFINLSKGRGINGLSGIPRKTDRLYRPLLSISRDEIISYASDHEVDFAVDPSNEGTDYDRNFIRHEVIPSMDERFGHFSSLVSQSMAHLAEVREFIDAELNKYLSEYSEDRGPFTLIRHTEKWPTILLKHLLIKRDFNRTSIMDLTDALFTPGKLFSSGTYEVVTTTTGLTIAPVETSQIKEVKVPEPGRYEVGSLDIVLSEVSPPGNISDDPAQILVSKTALEFPLTIRKWSRGDRMQPLGMTGSKKVQDILTDEKIDQLRKRHALVLLDAKGRIVWLIGVRMSEAFKLGSGDSNALRIMVDRLPF